MCTQQPLSRCALSVCRQTSYGAVWSGCQPTVVRLATQPGCQSPTRIYVIRSGRTRPHSYRPPIMRILCGRSHCPTAADDDQQTQLRRVCSSSPNRPARGDQLRSIYCRRALRHAASRNQVPARRSLPGELRAGSLAVIEIAPSPPTQCTPFNYSGP